MSLWIRKGGWIVIVLLLGLLGAIVVFRHAYLSCDPNKLPCDEILKLEIVGAVAAFLVAAIPLTVSQIQNRRKDVQRAQRQVKLTLQSAIQEIFKSEIRDHIRANVMLINRSKELYIYCGLNMVRLVIKGLRFKRGQGACGVAWELAEVGVEEGWKPIFALDLDQSNVQLWGLDATQIKLTQELTWIVSTPIRQKNKVIGIFNIDGVKPIELNMFEAAKTKYKGEHKFISICVNFAENLREELRQYNIV